MTDQTASSFIHIRTTFRLPRFPALGIGQKLTKLNEALSLSHHMVFVAPYRGQAQKDIITEGSETGRDPNW